MPNSRQTTTLKVSEDLYNRLTLLKNHLGITYAELVDTLIELELKQNYIIDTMDFIFITEKNDYPFRVTFKKHENIIEFNVKGQYVRDKNDWVMSAKDKSLFSKFINKPGSSDLLYNMGNSMEFNKFVIIRA